MKHLSLPAFSNPASPVNKLCVCQVSQLRAYGLYRFSKEKAGFCNFILNKDFCVTDRECSEYSMLSGL